MFGFFESVALEGFGDFGIAFAVGLARHCQVHAYFGAFAVEVGLEVLDHLGVAAFGHAELMLCYELESLFGIEFFEF